MERSKLKYPGNLTFLGFQFNALLDSGESLDIQETQVKIEEEKLFSWLKDLYGKRIDISLFSPVDLSELEELFASLSNAIDEERKMGIRKNGLCLLIGYCLELIQNKPECF